MRDPSSLMFLRNFDIYYPLGRTNRHDPLSDGGKLMAPMKFPGFSFSYELGKRLSPTEQSEESCHPLFIYSHDEGGSSVENNALLWSLASRGFIVAAPYHGPFPQSLHDRPREVVNVLNYFLSDQMGSPFTICKDGDGKTQVAVGGHGLGAFTALAVANGHTMPAKLREDFPVLVNAPDFAADTRFKVVVASSPRTLDFNGYALFNSEQGSSGKTTIPDLEGKGVKTLVLGALLDTTSSIANNVDPITNTIQCEVEPDPVNGRPKQKSGRTKQTFRADYKFAGHSGFIDHCPLHEQLENHIVQEGYRIFNYAHLPGLEKLDATSVCLGLLSRDPDDVIGAGHKEGATQLFIPLCNEYWTSLRTAAEAGCLGHKHDAVCGIFEGIAANEQLRLLRDDPICSLATGHPLTGDRGAVIDYTQYACSIRSKLMPYIDRFQCVTSPIGYISALHFQVRTTVAHIHETIYGDDKCFDWSLMDDTLVQLDQGVDEGNLFLREKAAGYCFDGPMCYPNKQNGSDDCKEGDRVPEQFRSDEGNCARCMTYTAQYLTPVPNSHGYYENPDFCDGRGGERVRCHSKRDHGVACHENWQCDVHFKHSTNENGRGKCINGLCYAYGDEDPPGSNPECQTDSDCTETLCFGRKGRCHDGYDKFCLCW